MGEDLHPRPPYEFIHGNTRFKFLNIRLLLLVLLWCKWLPVIKTTATFLKTIHPPGQTSSCLEFSTCSRFCLLSKTTITWVAATIWPKISCNDVNVVLNVCQVKERKVQSGSQFRILPSSNYQVCRVKKTPISESIIRYKCSTCSWHFRGRTIFIVIWSDI